MGRRARTSDVMGIVRGSRRPWEIHVLWGIHLLWLSLMGSALWLVFPVMAEPRADRACLQCHGQKDRTVVLQEHAAPYVDMALLRSSVHRKVSCTACHVEITQIPHKEPIAPVQCVHCHYKGNPRQAPSQPAREYAESVHAGMEEQGKQKPSCASCHGNHDILPPTDAQSRVYKLHVPETCGQCHQAIYEQYRLSVHGKALLWDGVLEAPSCVDCHGVHRILPPKDPASSVYPTHVSQTCAACHEAVEVVGKYGISPQRVSTYRGSYHGLANRYGVRAVANCASCHGVHNILPSTDPASSIHPDNLRHTCGKPECHPQASVLFARGAIHTELSPTPHAITQWIQTIYIAFIFLLISGMIVHNVLDYRSLKRGQGHADR